jgi:hypothetical protein
VGGRGRQARGAASLTSPQGHGMTWWTGLSWRWQCHLASAVGGAAATVVFTWLLLEGRWAPLAAAPLGEFFDAQGRSLLDREWHADAEAFSYERFEIDGRYYTYFGPWPAILRLPVLAVSSGFDGRLSRVSMFLAFVVFLAFSARLIGQIRGLVVGDAPMGRASLVAVAGFVFVVGCGAPALSLATSAWVYHEAGIWGLAWAMGAFSFLLSYAEQGRARYALLASLAVTLALLSRLSLGLGPLLALVVLLGVQLYRRRRRPETTPAGAPWVTAAAIVMPVLVHVYVNYAKFGELLQVPWEKQDLIATSPVRVASLAETGGTLTGVEYIPTNVVEYFRPAGIDLWALFPWVDFPDRAESIGHLARDMSAPAASFTVTSVLLLVLAAIGLVALVRSARRPSGLPVAQLSVPILASAAAFGATLVVAATAERYKIDLLPFLVMSGAVGLFWLPTVLPRGRRRALAISGLGLLAVWSVWTNLGLALVGQRLYAPFQPPDVRSGFVEFQLDVHDRLEAGTPRVVRVRASGPLEPRPTAPIGTLAVVGDCQAIEISDGGSWLPVASGPGARPLCERLADAGDVRGA